jgi:UDP-glucuronate 4-epimerase
LLRLLDKPATLDPEFDAAKLDPATNLELHRLFNIGNSNDTLLIAYIEKPDQALAVTSKKELLTM